MSLTLILTLLVALLTPPAPFPGQWDLGQWSGITGGLQCSRIDGDVLRQECESGALISTTAYDADTLTVEAEVLVEPSTAGGPYWAALALNSGDASGDGVYATAILARGIESNSPVGIAMASVSSTGRAETLATAEPGIWRRVRVVAQPSAAYVTIGQVTQRYAVTLPRPLRVELLCVAVRPGESSAARARCQWRNLSITVAS